MSINEDVFRYGAGQSTVDPTRKAVFGSNQAEHTDIDLHEQTAPDLQPIFFSKSPYYNFYGGDL